MNNRERGWPVDCRKCDRCGQMIDWEGMEKEAQP